jgi:hypothetical protein
VPGISKRLEYVLLGLIRPEANDPLFATTWWLTVSTFFHCTVSPPATVTVLGAKPVDLMFTVFVALKEATAKPAPARAHTAVAVSNALRIGGSP